MKGIVRFLVRMFVFNIVLIPLMVLGPLFYVIPFFCIVANPQDNFSGLAQLYFWLGPAVVRILDAGLVPLADSPQSTAGRSASNLA